MTQTRITLIAFLFTTIALLAGAQLMPDVPVASAAVTAQDDKIDYNRIDAIPEGPASLGSTADVERIQASALVPGTELDARQVQQVLVTADQVCEGLTAGVPVAVLTGTLVAEQNMTGPQARDFVNEVATTRC